MSEFRVDQGWKVGVHAQKPTPELFDHLDRAAAQGTPFPVVKLTQEQTSLRDVKERSPQTLTMARIINPLDGLGGIDTMAAGDASRWAEQVMAPIFQYYELNPDLVQFVDIQELINEADPPTVQGWHNMGLVMKECVRLGRQRLPDLAWAVGSFNAGTPEWNEALAFLESGVFDGAREAGDVVLAVHEGVLHPDHTVDTGNGDLIPGAPTVPPGGGSLFGRVAYIAMAAGTDMVPVIVSEAYLQAYGDPDEVRRRAAWMDDLFGSLWYMLASLPFTHSPTAQWQHQNYTGAYPQLLQYATTVRERQNAQAPQAEPQETVQAFVWRQSKERDTINPQAALQKAIFEAGYVPYSTEFWREFEDGNTYAIQTAFDWPTGERAVAFVKVPDWGNVRLITGPGNEE